MPLPERKLHRLSSWDYHQNGYYHITICTHQKRKLLSTIHQSGTDCIATPTALGEMIKAHWENMVSVSPYIKLDYYCLMPNHLHGIIVIEAPENTDHPSISELIRGFKSVTTRQYNKLVPPENKNTLWQASFYDEIIRNEDMLYQIRKYIEGNPSKWLTDNMYVE